MGYRTWVYHKTQEAKIVDSDEREALEEEGWRDHQDKADKAKPLSAYERKARDKARAEEVAREAEEAAKKAVEEAESAKKAAGK